LKTREHIVTRRSLRTLYAWLRLLTLAFLALPSLLAPAFWQH